MDGELAPDLAQELAKHLARCEDCNHTVIAYNSCRNRHCPWFDKLTMRVSGRRRDGMARRARGRSASGCVLP